MSLGPITSFVVRCQHIREDGKQLKIKLTHVQTNEASYYEKLDDAFQKMREIVTKNEMKKG